MKALRRGASRLNNIGELGGIKRGPAHKRTVNVGLRKELGGGRRLNTATIKNTNGLGRRLRLLGELVSNGTFC